MSSSIRRFINSIPSNRTALELQKALDLMLPTGKDTEVVAGTTQTQAGATVLRDDCSFHNVITVTTASDGVALPPPKIGVFHFVKNSAAANAMKVYAETPGTIDSTATATGVTQLAGDAVLYFCMVDGDYLRLGGVAATEVFGAITADSITGSDSSLGVTGLASTTGGAVVVTGGASSTSSTAGGAASLVGGAGGATGVGGAALVTGAAGQGGAVGGAATVTAGAGQGTGNGAVASVTGGASGAGATGTGGVSKVVGGASGATNGAGGAAQLTGGAGIGTGDGGAAVVTGGAAGATGTGGAVNLTGGTATAGVGGAVVVAGAAGVGSNKAGGLASVTGGASTGNATGGVASLVGGAGSAATGVGGAALVTGGAGNTTGAGGAVTVTAGAGGNNAVGGVASLVAGAAGGGNNAGGAAVITGGAGAGTGAGGAVTITGGASTAGGATGKGGAVNLTGGAAATTNDDGGSIALTVGAKNGTGLPGIIRQAGIVMKTQATPQTFTSTATLTAAQIVGGILEATHAASGANVDIVLPTGSVLSAGLPASLADDDAFDLVIINIGTNAAADTYTLIAGSQFTIVGNPIIQSNHSSIASTNTGTFRIRRTAADTFVAYRIA